MSERINETSEYGTGRRGFGTKIHFVTSWSYDTKAIWDANTIRTIEGKHYSGMQANCNSNGQWTARDFQAGTAREVTCLICNPKEDLPTPAERTPKADSCQATNKKTGKQCTFKGYCTSNLTGGRRCATHQDWRSPGGQGYPDYVAPVVLPVSVEGEEPFTHEYTFCNRCDQEFQVDDGTCPNCGIDLILPENHRIRVEHREWVARLDSIRSDWNVNNSDNWTDESSLPAFCEVCGHADPSNLTQLSSIDGESVSLLCFSCKDTRIRIRQIQGTPGPARLAKMFPMGRRK